MEPGGDWMNLVLFQPNKTAGKNIATDFRTLGTFEKLGP